MRGKKRVVVDDIVFTQDPKTKYYAAFVDGKHMRLHQYIWIRENGPIPDGYDVHHIDFDKTNNSIDNLVLLTKSEHHSLHGKIVPTKVIACKVCGTVAIRRHNSLFCSNACKSKWRRESGRDDITIICDCCGKEFKRSKYKINKGKPNCCSYSCASRLQAAHRNFQRKSSTTSSFPPSIHQESLAL